MSSVYQSACGGNVLIVGMDSGLVIALAAQKKSLTSSKIDVQPSYIATQHARRVRSLAATDTTFTSASDDCTILVSQIGCLFGASRMRYRITGAHALPITSLVYSPTDTNVLYSSSLDGTIVAHRLHFVNPPNSVGGGSSVRSVVVPSVSLAQSIDKMVRLPFPISSMVAIAPADGTLVAAAGLIDGVVHVAIVDFGVAQRDGNGSGRPLQPFIVLPVVNGSAPQVAPSEGTVKLCLSGSLLVADAGTSSLQWDVADALKAIAIGRGAEDAKGTVVERSICDGADSAFEEFDGFVGGKDRVDAVLSAITNPRAEPNAYYGSLYSNLCWASHSWSRPASCIAPVDPKRGKKSVIEASDNDSGSDSEGDDQGTAQGFGKRARKNKARATRAGAEAAEWSRLALAIDSFSPSEVDVLPLLNSKLCRHASLVDSRSVVSCESPYAYEPFVNAIGSSTNVDPSLVRASDEEEAAAMARLALQKSRNGAIQARIDLLYTAVSAAVAKGKKSGGSKRTDAEVEASPPSNKRPSKKHTSESNQKSLFSLT